MAQGPNVTLSDSNKGSPTTSFCYTKDELDKIAQGLTRLKKCEIELKDKQEFIDNAVLTPYAMVQNSPGARGDEDTGLEIGIIAVVAMSVGILLGFGLKN